MTKRTIAGLTLIVLVLSLSMTGKSVQRDPSIQTFWTKFKAAVIKGDKIAVAQMSQFPIELEYGVPSVKTSAQLIKRYREVFNGETNAAKCFAESKPEVDPRNSKRFTVGCKIENTGDVVIIYGFVRTKTGWKFNSLDKSTSDCALGRTLRYGSMAILATLDIGIRSMRPVFSTITITPLSTITRRIVDIGRSIRVPSFSSMISRAPG
jgi:hypothetical protein